MGIRITTDMMADAMGIPVQSIRIGLQQGVYPFGVALKKNERQSRANYIIYPAAAKEVLGEERYNAMIAAAEADAKKAI